MTITEMNAALWSRQLSGLKTTRVYLSPADMDEFAMSLDHSMGGRAVYTVIGDLDQIRAANGMSPFPDPSTGYRLTYKGVDVYQSESQTTGAPSFKEGE